MWRMKPHALAGLLVVSSALAAACSSSSSPSSGTSSSGASSSGGVDASGDTWVSWAQGFFSTYCVECHSSSNPTGRDFTQQSIVVANKDTIRCGVCVQQDPSWGCPASPPAEQFPIFDSTKSNPKPTDAERDRVVAWITAGCP
jgi:hypothetical protein